MPPRSVFTHPPAELLALLAACKERPEDDAPRLVLADWLEEHGRSPAERGRAEMIRLQCRDGGRPDYDFPPDEETRRLDELWRRYRRTWLGLLPDPPYSWRAERGLLRYAGGAEPWWQAGSAEGRAPASWAWVEGAQLGGLTPRGAERLACLPTLRWINSLDLYNCPIGLRGLRALAGSPHLDRLSHLSLPRTGMTANWADVLAQSPYLANLTWLDIRANDLGPRAAEALAASPHLRRLRKLDLAGCNLGDRGALALASAPILNSVEELDLRSNRLTTPGVEALCHSPQLARLTNLCLGHNELDLAALANSPALPRLRGLALERTSGGLAGVTALAARLPPGLTRLNLSWVALGDDGARALAGSPGLTALRELDVTGCEIGPVGVSALVRSPRLQELRCLKLCGNRVAGAAGDVAAAASLARLRYLDLAHSGITGDGARALAASPYLSELCALSLVGNRPGTAGRKALKQRFGRAAMLTA